MSQVAPSVAGKVVRVPVAGRMRQVCVPEFAGVQTVRNENGIRHGPIESQVYRKEVCEAWQ